MALDLPDEQATIALAQRLAPQLQTPDVVLLEGDLGAGKTTLARALIRTLAGDTTLEVPSPTFTLVQGYDTQAGPVLHYDLYRLKRADEIEELGWDEALADSIVLVEWPERLGAYRPRQAKLVRLAMNGTGRSATCEGFTHVG